jgi:hypothetical protein
VFSAHDLGEQVMTMIAFCCTLARVAIESLVVSVPRSTVLPAACRNTEAANPAATQECGCASSMDRMSVLFERRDAPRSRSTDAATRSVRRTPARFAAL